MGKVPSFLGSVVDYALGTELTACDIKDLASDVRQVVFHSSKLIGEKLKPMAKVEIHVGGGCFRSYTPARIDSQKGEMMLLIHLHRKGVGSLWAEQLRIGSKVKAFGPENGVKTDLSATTHICFGDETALGAFVSLRASLPRAANLVGAVEVSDEAILSELGLTLARVKKTEETSLVSWLSHHQALPADTQAYLLGRTKSISQVRDFLLREHKFTKANIHTKAHWADGKLGL